MLQAWNRVKALNPAAKLVCIDLQPGTTTQAKSRPDILNIGGFSDQVFEVIATMVRGNDDPDLWVKAIEAIEL